MYRVSVCSAGVLVYSHQDGVENGDFILLHIVDEKLQLRYNLGSGAANLTSVHLPPSLSLKRLPQDEMKLK